MPYNATYDLSVQEIKQLQNELQKIETQISTIIKSILDMCVGGIFLSL